MDDKKRSKKYLSLLDEWPDSFPNAVLWVLCKRVLDWTLNILEP